MNQSDYIFEGICLERKYITLNVSSVLVFALTNVAYCLFNNFYQQSICIFQFNLQVHHNCITGGCDKEARGCYDVRMGQLA